VTPERWAQIEELFHRAAECDAQHRSALLDHTCSDDPELRREVEALLSCDKSGREHVEAAVCAEFPGFRFPLSGEIVSHYRIVDGLGGGGMGVVYRAEDLKLGRLVAIKFLPEESANNPVALSRFEREARSASALEHPNICPIYQFEEHEGRPFLVMQLLEGHTLKELLENKSGKSENISTLGNMPLQLEQIFDFASQIASGLEAAHRRGIIHRDIKPGNIFVTREGQVKILDFGLAKLAREVAAAADAMSGSSFSKPCPEDRAMLNPFVSRTGVAIGTAAYMSPEQVRGETLDVRTDLFSFGLVLYEMATGCHAFSGDTGAQLHEAILNTTPAEVRKVNPQVPAKLERIVKKAIEKDRDARYQNALEIRAELDTLRRDLSRTRLRRQMAVFAGIAVILLAGAFFWVARHRPTVAQVPPQIKFRQLTTNSPDNRVTTGSISQDGKYLAYVDSLGMHVKNVETGMTQAIPPPAVLKDDKQNWEILDQAWFPDNAKFLVNGHPADEIPDNWSSRTASIWIFSRLGATPQKVRDHATAWSVSPDGSQISFGTNPGKLGEREIWLMKADGRQAHKLIDGDENAATAGTLWSADGRRGLYVRTDAFGDTILNHNFDGGPPATVFTPAESKPIRGNFAWLPNGRLIYQIGDPGSGFESVTDTCNFWSIRLDPKTGKPIEKASPMTSWTGFCATDANATSDGKRIAFVASTGRQGTAYLADLDPTGTRLLGQRHFTLEQGDDFINEWLDNTTVIVGRNRLDHYELYKQSLDGGAQEPIAAIVPGHLIEGYVVSPDGKWVIVQAWPIGGIIWKTPVPVVRIPITGGTPKEIFTIRDGGLVSCSRPPSNLCTVAEPSDDRKEMIVTAFDPLKGRGRELARFATDPQMDITYYLQGRISPDGSQVLALRAPKGPIEIRSLQGGGARIINPKNVDTILVVTWAAEGKGFFLTNRTKDGSEILHMDLGGRTTLLWKSGSNSYVGGCGGVSSPDGRHLAIDDLQEGANMWMMENF
jgi:serine/threonine protein kinase